MKFEFLADNPDAIPIVARWYFDEWGYKIKDNSFEATCERIRTKLNRDKAPLHVIAIESNELLGAAQLKIREMDIFPEREYWLGSVFVPPNCRGRGIASNLATIICKVAKSIGVNNISLQTENLTGGLYAKLGWKQVQQVYYNGLDVLVMEKDLDV